MNRAIGFSMVLFSCLPLSTGCGSDGSDTTSPTANQPSFIAETHSATDSSTLPPGAPQSTASLSLNVSGTNTRLLATWHSKFDGGFPNDGTLTSNGVPGTSIVDTNGYTGGPGIRRFRI
jgi:hypothetical protein